MNSLCQSKYHMSYFLLRDFVRRTKRKTNYKIYKHCTHLSHVEFDICHIKFVGWKFRSFLSLIRFIQDIMQDTKRKEKKIRNFFFYFSKQKKRAIYKFVPPNLFQKSSKFPLRSHVTIARMEKLFVKVTIT